jgi:hypothetical protein
MVFGREISNSRNEHQAAFSSATGSIGVGTTVAGVEGLPGAKRSEASTSAATAETSAVPSFIGPPYERWVHTGWHIGPRSPRQLHQFAASHTFVPGRFFASAQRVARLISVA